LKQENAEFKVELIELKNNSDIKFNKKLIKEDKIINRQGISPASKFKVHKALNLVFLVLLYLTLNEMKSQSNEFNSPTNETKLLMELKAGIINNLKSKIREVPELLNRVTLINNATVVVVQISRNINWKRSTQCYDHRQCNDVIDQLGLSNHKILLNELLLEIPNHLYETGDRCYQFLFPFNLNNKKDFQISIPNKFNMKIIDKKVLVEMTLSDYPMILHVGKYKIRLRNGVTFNLEQLDDSMVVDSYINSYGYLYISW